MKTLKFIERTLFVIALCLVFSSCDEDSIVPEVTVEVGSEDYFVKNIDFGSVSGEKTFSFTSNVDWSISVASTRNGDSWCSVIPSSGSAGKNTVRISVQENTGYDDRNVVLTLTAGSLTKNLTITQKQKDALLLTTNKFELDPKGGKINVEVKSNVEYEAIIPETYKDWISLSLKSRGLVDSNLVFDIAETEEYDKREGEIIIKSGELSETVHVYQTGQAILLLTQNEYPVTDKGDTIAVEIKSNFDFDIQMPDVDWIVEDTESRGVSSHTLYYKIAPNESEDSRQAEIVYLDKNSSIKDTLKIVQAQKNAIVISQKVYDLYAEGGDIDIIISSNIEFEISVDCDWIKMIEHDSKAMIERKMQFKIERNIEKESRVGYIVVKNVECDLSETIVVNQYGDVLEINVEKAGTLSDFISEDDKFIIRSLKLSGELNGTDFKLIREMAGVRGYGEKTAGQLAYLDLTEVKIVEGGDKYYHVFGTKNNEITESMFWYCEKLSYLKLPSSITNIGQSAFSACTNLKTLIISEGVKAIGDLAFWSCFKLSSLDIPETVEVIGTGIFNDCISLKEIYIPQNINFIGNGNPFCGCDSLMMIEVSVDNQFYSSVNGVLYNKSLTELISYPLAKPEIEIYDGTKIIKKSAFYENSLITSCFLPEGVEVIEYSAFADCRNLHTVKFPSSLKRIEDSAFWLCYKLGAITIPSKVEFIDARAFMICGNLKTLNVDENNNTYASFDGLLYNKKKEKLLMCPEGKGTAEIYDGVKVIGEYAFDYCYNLKELSIPNSVDLIESAAFYRCDSLETLVMSSNVMAIKESTFRECSRLKSFVISENIKEIENFAFAGCKGLRELIVKHKTPLEIKSKCFMDVDKSKCILYVPKESVESYKSAKYWSEFINVKAIE